MKQIFLAGLFLVSSSPVFAEMKTYRFSPLNGKRQVTFYSKAPVENFEGWASDVGGSVQVDFSKKNLGLSGAITIPVMAMQTGVSMRDVHMRGKDWLNEGRYPMIRFEFTDPKFQKVKKKGKNKWFIKANGRFSLKGRTRNIQVPVTLQRKTNRKGEETILVKGGFPVNLKEFGIRGPAAMKIIGAKVSPDIKVTLKLVGSAQTSQPTRLKSQWR